MEEANENLEAADRMILNRRRVDKGTYLHSRPMRYFKTCMKDWPRLAPACSQRRRSREPTASERIKESKHG